MVYCVVPMCKSDKAKDRQNGVSFHEFPSSEELCLKWLLAIKRKDQYSSKPWVPSDHSAVCSKHFLPSDFRRHLKRRLLIRNAVPSVFNGYPPCFQIKPKKTRKTSKGKGTVPSNEHGTSMTKVPDEQETLMNRKVPGSQESLMNRKVPGSQESLMKVFNSECDALINMKVSANGKSTVPRNEHGTLMTEEPDKQEILMNRKVPGSQESLMNMKVPGSQESLMKVFNTEFEALINMKVSAKGKNTVPRNEHGTLMTEVPDEREALLYMKVCGGQKSLMNVCAKGKDTVLRNKHKTLKKVPDEQVALMNMKDPDERETIVKTEPPEEQSGLGFKDANVGTELTILQLNEEHGKMETLHRRMATMQRYLQKLNSKVSQYQSELKELKRENNQLRQEIAFFTK